MSDNKKDAEVPVGIVSVEAHVEKPQPVAVPEQKSEPAAKVSPAPTPDPVGTQAHIVSADPVQNPVPEPSAPVPVKQLEPVLVSVPHTVVASVVGSISPPPPSPPPTSGAGSGGAGDPPVPPPPHVPQEPTEPWRDRWGRRLLPFGHVLKTGGRMGWTALHGYRMTTPAHHRRMLAIGPWSGPIYGLLVGVGVPLIAVANPDVTFRFVCLFLYTFVGLLYGIVEVSQVEAQMQLGILVVDIAVRQRKRMQWPYRGIEFAVFVWVTAFALWLFAYYVNVERSISLHYGLIEWAILVLTWANASAWVNLVYPLLDRYEQATASQARFERNQH